MNKFTTLLLCTALGACASPDSEGAPPPVESAAQPAEQMAEVSDLEVEPALPEIRYYVISDG
jgi:hypothetical protein